MLTIWKGVLYVKDILRALEIDFYIGVDGDSRMDFVAEFNPEYSLQKAGAAYC
jgi:hypothetical protein